MANVRTFSSFDRKVKRLLKKHSSLIDDIINLGEVLSQNPTQGESLGAGLYKVRMASESKGKGKSGGFRIITYFVDESKNDQTVYLVTIYDKSEQSTIVKKDLLKIVTTELG